MGLDTLGSYQVVPISQVKPWTCDNTKHILNSEEYCRSNHPNSDEITPEEKTWHSVKNFIQTVKPTNCGSLTPPHIAPSPPANTPAGKVYRAYTATAIWGPFAKVVLSSYVWWLGNYRFYYRWYLNVRQNLVTVPYCHPQRRFYRVLEDQNRRLSNSETWILQIPLVISKSLHPIFKMPLCVYTYHSQTPK